MSDAIVLLEERKELTTFLLDEGTITETTVVSATGETEGYAYSAPIKPYDFVELSTKSEVGKMAVKKITSSTTAPIFGMLVNEPKVKGTEMREGGILVLGHILRFKLASGITNIATGDRLTLSASGVSKSTSGEYIAMHPVSNSDTYNYIEVFKPYEDMGSTGSTGSP